ncbi:MAG: hypothetical protein ACFCUE_15160 [Candidatus Bathyarchaeia archaeon]|jgi:hypothetical protein
MSQNNPKVRYLSDCSLSTAESEHAVVISASCQEASLKKRKEEANEILYIARI